MYYLKHKEDYQKNLLKVKDIYENKEKDIRILPLFKKYKYASFMHDDHIYGEYFCKALNNLISIYKDDSVDIFEVTDDKYANKLFKEENIYPSLHIDKGDFANIKEVSNQINNYPNNSDWISMYATANCICALSESLSWFFCMDRRWSICCFLTNDEKHLRDIREIVNIDSKKELDYENIFIPKNELIEEYNFAKNEEEFNKLPISKLKIIA